METDKIQISINPFWLAKGQPRIISTTESKFKIQKDKWIERRSTDEMKLLAQRPITLVLMMINSYSYRTNDLVFI